MTKQMTHQNIIKYTNDLPDNSKSVLFPANRSSRQSYDSPDDVHRNRASLFPSFELRMPLEISFPHYFAQLRDSRQNLIKKTWLMISTWRSAIYAANILSEAEKIYSGKSKHTQIMFLCGLKHEAEVAYFLENPDDLEAFLTNPFDYQPSPHDILSPEERIQAIQRCQDRVAELPERPGAKFFSAL